jgi:hypothetical protein
MLGHRARLALMRGVAAASAAAQSITIDGSLSPARTLIGPNSRSAPVSGNR